MKYLLDTNTCIYIIKKQAVHLERHLQKIKVGDLAISTITLSELEYGIAKSRWKEQNRAALAGFVASLNILPYDQKAAEQYGEVRVLLEKKGIPIGSMDLLIAAHALALGFTLITHNVREFSRIRTLRLEDWTI